MYRWSGGTLKHINRQHILRRNRCAGDAPAGYECIEPEVLAAMPLLRSLSQFFGVAAIQITLLRNCIAGRYFLRLPSAFLLSCQGSLYAEARRSQPASSVPIQAPGKLPQRRRRAPDDTAQAESYLCG
jgi:hypothetical protein